MSCYPPLILADRVRLRREKQNSQMTPSSFFSLRRTDTVLKPGGFCRMVCGRLFVSGVLLRAPDHRQHRCKPHVIQQELVPQSSNHCRAEMLGFGKGWEIEEENQTTFKKGTIMILRIKPKHLIFHTVWPHYYCGSVVWSSCCWVSFAVHVQLKPLGIFWYIKVMKNKKKVLFLTLPFLYKIKLNKLHILPSVHVFLLHE